MIVCVLMVWILPVEHAARPAGHLYLETRRQRDFRRNDPIGVGN